MPTKLMYDGNELISPVFSGDDHDEDYSDDGKYPLRCCDCGELLQDI